MDMAFLFGFMSVLYSLFEMWSVELGIVVGFDISLVPN